MRETHQVAKFLAWLPAAVLLVGFVAGCADHFIVPANRRILAAPNARQMLIDVDGRTVECWVERSPAAIAREPGGFVLFFVGKGDRVERWIDAVANAWGDYPVEIWGMNYPGSGSSDGPAKASLMAPDALATFDAMRKAAGPRPVYIHAGSLGTMAALCVAARRPVGGLVLQNPPPLRQLILGKHGWWNLWLLAGPVAARVPPELDSIANAARAKAPAVFIMADADQVVPPRYQRMVADAYAGPRREIHMPRARHDDPLTRAAAQQFARDLEWLWTSAQRESPGVAKYTSPQ